MSERKSSTQILICQYCGEKNQVSLSLYDLDFEGNNPSTRMSSERARRKQSYSFTCQWCKRKNTIN